MTEKPNDDCPDDRFYTERRLWIKKMQSGAAAAYEAGLAPQAFAALGAPLYLETPGAGKTVPENRTLILFESAKTVAEIPAPFELTITDIHEALVDEPKNAAGDPWNSWLVRFTADENAVENARKNGALLDAETFARAIRNRA
ncbi:MAG TPA: hypothetical protein PL077_02270 [Treponemataceae bacterium]|nr:hypothetical protein [Treponemataceae bacterium]